MIHVCTYFLFRSISLPSLFVVHYFFSSRFLLFVLRSFGWYFCAYNFRCSFLKKKVFTSICRFLHHIFQQNIIKANVGNECDNEINKTRQINKCVCQCDSDVEMNFVRFFTHCFFSKQRIWLPKSIERALNVHCVFLLSFWMCWFQQIYRFRAISIVQFI